MDILIGVATNFHHNREVSIDGKGQPHLLQRGDVLCIFQVHHRGKIYINPVIAAGDDPRDGTPGDTKKYGMLLLKNAYPDEALDGFSDTPYHPQGKNPHHCPRGDRADFLAKLFLRAHNLCSFTGECDGIEGAQSCIDLEWMAEDIPAVAAKLAKTFDHTEPSPVIEIDVETLKDYAEPVNEDHRAQGFQAHADFCRLQGQKSAEECEAVATANDALAAALADGPLKQALAVDSATRRRHGAESVAAQEMAASVWEAAKAAESAQFVTRKARYEEK